MVDNKAKNTKKPTLVIICGGSGSGKTTVAEKITSALDKGITYSIISLDNYYLPSYLIKTTNYDEPNALDWNRIISDISGLLARKKVSTPIYDFVKKDYIKYVDVIATDVIIVEGILALQNKELRDLADLKIYVDVPDDERLIRRLLRDITQRGESPEATIKMWRETVIDSHHIYVEPYKTTAEIIMPWKKWNDNAIIGCAGAIMSNLTKTIKK